MRGTRCPKKKHEFSTNVWATRRIRYSDKFGHEPYQPLVREHVLYGIPCGNETHLDEYCHKTAYPFVYIACAHREYVPSPLCRRREEQDTRTSTATNHIACLCVENMFYMIHPIREQLARMRVPHLYTYCMHA